jgi:hypothetical protein
MGPHVLVLRALGAASNRLTTTLSGAMLSADLFMPPPLPRDMVDRPDALSERLVNARAGLLQTSWSDTLFLWKLLKNMGLGAFNVGRRNILGGFADGRRECPQLSHVLFAILAHDEMQPDLKLLQRARGQVLIT